MGTEEGIATPKVPATKAELYQRALGKQMQQVAAGRALQLVQQTMMWVGAYAHLSTIPLFGRTHVAKAVSHDDACAACWRQLVAGGADQIPCFKVLDLDSDVAAYQPRHLSFQEFLCVTFFEKVVLCQQVALPDQFGSFDLCKWRSGKEHQAKALREPYNTNFFELACSRDGLSHAAFPGNMLIGYLSLSRIPLVFSHPRHPPCSLLSLFRGRCID
jgi:hypothetical protein